MKVKSLSCVWLFTTPWTVAYQASAFMGFSRQEYWSGVPLPSPNLMLLCFYWLPNICKPTFFIFHGLQDPWLPGSSLAFKLCVCVCVQLCPTLCDPMDGCRETLPGSFVHGIFQARILEWDAISSSRGSSWPRDRISVSCISWTGTGILYQDISPNYLLQTLWTL